MSSVLEHHHKNSKFLRVEFLYQQLLSNTPLVAILFDWQHTTWSSPRPKLHSFTFAGSESWNPFLLSSDGSLSFCLRFPIVLGHRLEVPLMNMP